MRLHDSGVGYRQEANRIARAENVPPWLFRRLIGAESNWNPGAVSGAGAIGLGQLMPDTARGLGVDPRDPVQNLRGSARYLRQQYDRFGNWRLALAAYNAGPGAVEKAGGVPAFSETRAYVQRILGDRGGGGDVGGGGARSGGGGRGALLAPQEARALPEGSAGLLPLLQALSGQQGPSQPASGGLAAPEFSAGPVLPAGMQVPASSGGPAQRPDVGAMLTALTGVQGAGVARGSVPGVQMPVRGPGGQMRAGGGGSLKADVDELIWAGKGAQFIDQGRPTAPYAAEGHRDHVHVSTYGKKGAVRLGRLAERMGLTVRENPAFDPVDPVHSTGSAHYSGRAIDVSGDPELMRRFARLVAQGRRNR